MSALELLCLWSVAPTQAYQLTPLSATLKPSGSGASQTFELENKSENPVPVEISIARRGQDLDCQDVLDSSPAAEEKFIIYPPQFILDPKSIRSVKVTWAGGTTVDAEQAFRVNFTELSVPLPKDKEKPKKAEAKINLLFNYSAAVYVVPDKAVAKFSLVSAGPSSKDPKKLEMIVENTGTAHATLKGFTATLVAPDKRQTLLTEQDAGAGTGWDRNVLVGSKLRFLVPWPPSLPKGPLSGDFVPKL